MKAQIVDYRLNFEGKIETTTRIDASLFDAAELAEVETWFEMSLTTNEKIQIDDDTLLKATILQQQTGELLVCFMLYHAKVAQLPAWQGVLMIGSETHKSKIDAATMQMVFAKLRPNHRSTPVVTQKQANLIAQKIGRDAVQIVAPCSPVALVLSHDLTREKALDWNFRTGKIYARIAAWFRMKCETQED